jgi:hypothetical protein
MKSALRTLLSGCWLIVIFTMTLQAQTDARKKKKEPECGGNCFQTEVLKATATTDGCVDYQLKISHDGTCRYELSHVTFQLLCGNIRTINNSENWKQEIGKDPTTGLVGFKIDDIGDFGKGEPFSFTVDVTICSDTSCLRQLGVVAYKAGQCVDYDTLDYDPPLPGGGGEDPGDSTSTCSTLRASLQMNAVSCFGRADGSLRVSIEDGKAPFSYAWSTGSTDSVLTQLIAGTYTVTVTDANQNVLTLTETITQPQEIVIDAITVNPSCSGIANGAITTSVSGGSGSFSLSWNNGSVATSLANLAAGFYTLTVTDQVTGCTQQKSWLLSNASRITLSSSVTRPGCAQASGSINLTVSNGTAPYAFAWSNGATTQDIAGLTAGTYSVIVNDANGCQATSTIVVTVNNTLRVDFTVTPAGCSNEPTGTIDLMVTGGTAPYTYQWQHGATAEDLTALASGIYRVTVTDATGCSVLTPINVPKRTIQVNTEIIQPRCIDDNLGTITVTPLENGDYTYTWSNGSTSNSITVPAGTYTVTITDASGCSRTLSYTITLPTPLNIGVVTGNTQCGSEGFFYADLTVTGGKTPYTYQWSNGAITPDLLAVTSGTYTVTVTDANGCTAQQAVIIDPAVVNWECLITPVTSPPVCLSAGNALSTDVTGALYQWQVTSSDNSWAITSGAGSGAVIYQAGTPGSTATFTLTITKDGCTRTCQYTLSAGCVVRDNNGGGDPNTGDPCEDENTETPPSDPPTEDPEPEPEPEHHNFKFCAYPNPFEGRLSFELTSDRDEYARIEIMDQHGKRIAVVYEGEVRKGERYTFEFIPAGLRDRIYFYRYRSGSRVKHGKLFRRG